MSDASISVQILDKENAIKYIPFIRNFTKEALGEIKRKIQEGDNVLVCEYIKNSEELPKLFETINNLKSKGAHLKIIQSFYRTQREINLEIIKNLIESDEIISKQVEEYADRIADE